MINHAVLFTPANYTMLLIERRVLNNLLTTSLRSKCFCGVLEGRKIKERWLGCFGCGKSGARAKYGTGGEEGREHLQANPVILKTLFGSDVACDYLSLNQLLWTCINH